MTRRASTPLALRLHLAMAVMLAIAACGGADQPATAPDADRAIDGRTLSAYRPVGDAVRIAGVYTNLSGVTWCPPRDGLFMVLNGPERLLECDRDGSVRQRWELPYDDTEGIAWIDAQRFAIVEEGARYCRIVSIGANGELAEEARARIIDEAADNRGIEGIAWNRDDGILYAVKEYGPRRVLHANWNGADAIDIWQDAFAVGDHIPTATAADLAGIAWHAPSGSLLILSDEGSRILRCRPDGTLLEELVLDLPQAEGITVHPDGAIFVVSEPNWLLELQADP